MLNIVYYDHPPPPGGRTRSSDLFYKISCYIKWATTSWTYSNQENNAFSFVQAILDGHLQT